MNKKELKNLIKECINETISDEVSLFDQQPIPPGLNKESLDFLKRVLRDEKNWLKTDKERYLEYMNGVSMTDRVKKSPDKNTWNESKSDVRNGLILAGLYIRYALKSDEINEMKSSDNLNTEYELSNKKCDGLDVIENDIPNLSSIKSSLNDYKILHGIRNIPVSEFSLSGKSYSVDGTNRIKKLTNEIQNSNQIKPLIVVIDNDGPYVLEGSHRAEALFLLNKKYIPALIVLDLNSLNIMNEMAYPASFSMEQFNSIKSYKGKYDYARQHLQRLAAGSSRVILKIDEEKVLKLAKNEKGLAQNNIETDGYLRNHPITAHVFDYDDKHDRPYWLEMEYAKKLSPKRFQQLTGFTLDELELLLRAVSDRHNNSRLFSKPSQELQSKANNSEWFNDLQDMALNMGMILPGDFTRISTYGEVLRDGKPTVVVIDFGLTKGVYDDYYAR